MRAFIPGFKVVTTPVEDAVIHAEMGGSGPPLLLLHGYPQTHVAWHRVAPLLAKEFTVIAPDLRGYGDSVGPPADPARDLYSKRTMARDQWLLMQSLGFERFAVAGHDRGARVAHRLALDYPQAVAAFMSLTVIPTPEMWARANMRFGLKAWHWFALAQPHDLPERILAADPAYFLDVALKNMAVRPDAVTPQARAEYHRAFIRPEVRRAMIEDYRAAASIDMERDEADRAAGRQLACPLLVIWEASQYHGKDHTPVDIWRNGWATDVQGLSILNCGHLLMEEAPDEVSAAMLQFLGSHWR